MSRDQQDVTKSCRSWNPIHIENYQGAGTNAWRPKVKGSQYITMGHTQEEAALFRVERKSEASI